MVLNKIPKIGIIKEIENSENKTDKKLKSVFNPISGRYGCVNFKILKVLFMIQI